MKKIILIVGGIILVAVLGRGIWAYQQMKKDEAKINNASPLIVDTVATSTVSTVSALAPAPVVVTMAKPCPASNKTNKILVSGQVIFPKGIKNQQDYSIVILPENYKISSDGRFCAYIEKGAVKVLGAVSGKSENDFPLMFVVNSDKNLNVVVDAYSMAVAMVFMSPFLMHNDPIKASEILNKIRVNQKTIELANKIKSEDILSADNIDEGGSLHQLYLDVIKSVLGTIASTAVTTPSTIEFTAIFSPGFYSKGVVQGTMASVTPTFVGDIDVKKILQRVFVVTDSTKFLNTTKPVGTQIIEFKSATVTGYYDVRKQTVFVESISNVQL